MMDPPTSLNCLTVTYNVNQFRITQPLTTFLNPFLLPMEKENGTTATTTATTAFETNTNDPDIIAVALQEVSGAGYFIDSTCSTSSTTSSFASEALSSSPTSPLLPISSTDSSTTATVDSTTSSSSWLRSCLLEPEDIEYWKTKVLKDFNLEPSSCASLPSSSSSSSSKHNSNYLSNPAFQTTDSNPRSSLESSAPFQPRSETKKSNSQKNEKRNQTKKNQYQLLKHTGIGGLLLIIVVKEELLPWLHEIETNMCIVGPLGFPNKGAVGISFRFTPFLSLCFINVHLSAGNGSGMNTHRASQLQFILQQLGSPSICSSTTQVLNHDMVFLMGDFNFRLTFPSPSSFPFPQSSDTTSVNTSTTTSSIAHELNYASWDSFSPLLPFILPSFQELPIQFEPTYKWLPIRTSSSAYTSSNFSLKSSLVPTRVPGYTDRICFYIHPESTWRLIPLRYTAFPYFIQSDHRPVVANFHLKCTSSSSMSSTRVLPRGVITQVRSLQSWSFFLPSQMPFIWIFLLRHRYSFLSGLSIFVLGSVFWFISNRNWVSLSLPWK